MLAYVVSFVLAPHTTSKMLMLSERNISTLIGRTQAHIFTFTASPISVGAKTSPNDFAHRFCTFGPCSFDKITVQIVRPHQLFSGFRSERGFWRQLIPRTRPLSVFDVLPHPL